MLGNLPSYPPNTPFRTVSPRTRVHRGKRPRTLGRPGPLRRTTTRLLWCNGGFKAIRGEVRRVTPVLEMKAVSKLFGEKRALSGIDFRVETGEVVALLGPNGAGKTTAIAIMLGLRKASSGEVRLFGRRPRDLGARSRVGVML